MDRDRDLLAVLFVAYAIGSGVAISRMGAGSSAPLPIDAPIVLAGLQVAVYTGLLVAGFVAAARAIRAAATAPPETKVSLALALAVLGFLAVSTWIGAPYDVMGDRWIASPATPAETTRLRFLAVGLLVLAGGALGWVYDRDRRSSRRGQ